MITVHEVISSTYRYQRKYLGSQKAFCFCSVMNSFYDLKQNRNNVSVSKAYDGINLPLFLWTLFLGTHTVLFREQAAFSELSHRLAQ